MPVYKVKAKANYGDMPKGYELQVVSASTPPSGHDIEKEIARLGFNKEAQNHSSNTNFEVVKG